MLTMQREKKCKIALKKKKTPRATSAGDNVEKLGKLLLPVRMEAAAAALGKGLAVLQMLNTEFPYHPANPTPRYILKRIKIPTQKLIHRCS